MDIFDLLREDHLEIDDLLARLERPPGQAGFDRAGRDYLLDRLVAVASRHEAAEEMTFWPHVRRRLSEGDELADQALTAENDAKAVLDLLRFVQSEEDLVEKCARLHVLTREHAGFEEAVVFPLMRARTTRVWSALAGMRFRAARRIGPTRPHPGGPDRPAGLLTRGLPASLADHLRDLRSRRRRHPVGFEEPGRPDAMEVVVDDHVRLRELMTSMERQDDPDDGVVQALIREISVHDSMERQYLYPAARERLEHGNEIYQRAIAEHGQVSELAARIDAYPFHDEGRRAWLGELVGLVRAHMQEEESQLLPELAARMTPEELIDLGSLLQRARGKAPTRPHPHIAGAGIGARVSRLVAGPVDGVRDVVSGRRRAGPP